MNRLKVYIASPYTIGDKEQNVKRQMEMSADLIELGFTPYAPLLSHFINLERPIPESIWLNLDLEWIDVCDVLLRLPGESYGADIEVEYAEQKGIPVAYNLADLHNINIKRNGIKRN